MSAMRSATRDPDRRGSSGSDVSRISSGNTRTCFSPFCSAPPLLWLGIVYLGSLLALLLQSFFFDRRFSGLINYEFTLTTYAQLLNDANFDIIIRTVLMAAIVTLSSAVIAFPIAYYAARYAQGKMESHSSISASCCRSGRAISSRSTRGNSSSPRKAFSPGS